MSKVVDRCPSCGVEHDHPVHECEACGSDVRFWCRTHSREIGWLESGVCPRCPPGVARPRPPKPAPPPAAAPTPAPPVSRPYLRFDRSAARAEAPAPTRSAAAPPPVETSALKMPSASPPASAPPAVAAPAAAPVPEAPRNAAPARQRRGMGVRLFEAALTVMQTGIVGVILGVGAGGSWAYFAGAEVPLEAAIGGAKGGMAGLALGVLIAVAFFRRSAYPREE